MYDTIMLWLGKKDIGDEYNYENVLRKIYKLARLRKYGVVVGITKI